MEQPPRRFVSDLTRICLNYKNESQNQSTGCILVLIDGSNTETGQLLLCDEKETNELNRITVDNESEQDDIALIQKYLVDIDQQRSYYLGGRLFALFTNNTMKQAVLIVEKLLNDLKTSIHFTLAIGMATIGCNMIDNNSDASNKQELQRNWVSMTYTNVLRAKEAGSNCFFNNEVCLYGFYTIEKLCTINICVLVYDCVVFEYYSHIKSESN